MGPVLENLSLALSPISAHPIPKQNGSGRVAKFVAIAEAELTTSCVG